MVLCIPSDAHRILDPSAAGAAKQTHACAYRLERTARPLKHEVSSGCCACRRHGRGGGGRRGRSRRSSNSM